MTGIERDRSQDSGWTRLQAGGRVYDRVILHSTWLHENDDLLDTLRTMLAGTARPGDTVFVSEKVVLLLAGRTVPVDIVRPGRLAYFLVRHVRPRPGSRGLAVPEKMQYVLDQSGRLRVLAAAAVSAISRPLGWHGLFYRVAGSIARDLDGGRPPYEHLLFPPLGRSDGLALADDLESQLGIGVAIVDLNDYGGSIRAASASAPTPFDLQMLLRDNPLGQRASSTPAGLLRPLPTPASEDAQGSGRRRRVNVPKVSLRRWSSGARSTLKTPT